MNDRRVNPKLLTKEFVHTSRPFMEIAFGSKRITILAGMYAIKIGRIRFLRLASRALVLPFSERLRRRYLNKYGESWWKAIMSDLFAGMICNRREYEYYRSSSDGRVMPTIKKLFGGHIVIQVRGTAAPTSAIAQVYPGYPSKEFLEIDLGGNGQFCLDHDGRVRIDDYGDPSTLTFLRRVP